MRILKKKYLHTMLTIPNYNLFRPYIKYLLDGDAVVVKVEVDDESVTINMVRFIICFIILDVL